MKKRNDKYKDIVALYPVLPTKKIAEITGKSRHTIRTIAVANGLSKQKYYWTKKEDDFLIDNYFELGTYACAEKLNRTRDAVIGRWRKIKPNILIEKERTPPKAVQ